MIGHTQLSLIFLCLFSCGLSIVPFPVLADDAAWKALEEPGSVALMRHATAPGVGDPPGFRLDDCTTQRNLSEAGKAEARAVGMAFREHGIVVGRVLTSRWCRARDTAELLALGPVEPFPPLDSFFDGRGSADRQTDALRSLLAGRTPTERLVLVTHQVNITALTGINPASGEVIVLGLGADGRAEVRGRIAPGR